MKGNIYTECELLRGLLCFCLSHMHKYGAWNCMQLTNFFLLLRQFVNFIFSFRIQHKITNKTNDFVAEWLVYTISIDKEK